MLGEAFYNVFKSSYELKCTDKDVNTEWLKFLDFRDLDAYRKDVESFRPDYLFHLGAYTDLEYCERNVEDAYKTNTTSVENAVWISNKLDIPLALHQHCGNFRRFKRHLRRLGSAQSHGPLRTFEIYG